jgi:hypothetical protein
MVKPINGLVNCVNNTVCIFWRYIKDILLLSRAYGGTLQGKLDHNTRQPIFKPSVVVLYNKNMGSVDTGDFISGVYWDMRKMLKWYEKLAFYPSDVAATNYYTSYIKGNKNKISLHKIAFSHMTFKVGKFLI